MSAINHIFEPSRLFLVWHHSGDCSPRHRRIVGELVRDGDTVKFRYAKNSDDYKQAEKEGFIGFPAFTKNVSSVDDALDAFSTRLPPRKRADFGRYLSQYGLPEEFTGSYMALLGYTGARLESDSFELCPDYSDVTAPADILIELTGVRYHISSSEMPQPGTQVKFQPEPENEHDPKAIAVHSENGRIGYINKAVTSGFARMLEAMKVTGTVLRTGSSEAHAQIILLVQCR